MVNYYNILKVSPKATRSEIKSAYRRLARELHPDVNSSQDSSREFALVAEAYQILSNKKTRLRYDEFLFNLNNSGDSVFQTDNQHAQRLRRMAFEKRFNDIVDQMMDAERKESLALQSFVFPVVALLVSTAFVAIFRPLIWSNSNVLGKIILLTLFVVGVLHLFNRLKFGFQKYTYPDSAPESIWESENLDDFRPYSRRKVILSILGGLGLCLVIGYVVGQYFEVFIATMMPQIFSPTLQIEMVLYPPIVALVVDLMHKLAGKVNL